MATSVVNPRVQFFANNGRPLIGGRIHTYVAGSSTRARTYKDAAKAQPNTNPIVLDGRGEAQIYLDEGVEYKFVVEDSKGALIYTQEPVYGAIWPNAADWPSDATLSYRYMNEAKAAAGAIGPLKFYDTYAQASANVGSLSDGDIIEVSQDEGLNGARTRYRVASGALLFLVNLDQLRIDLASTGSAKGSEIVSFIQAGPGAVLRTSQDKMRESVSVTDFGAKPGGIFDCTAAFQAAVDNSSCVYVPPGVWLISDPGVMLPDGAHIFGAGKTKSILKKKASSGSDQLDPILRERFIAGVASAARNITIESVGLEGNGDAGIKTPKAAGLLRFYESYYIRAVGCAFYKGRGYGAGFEGSQGASQPDRQGPNEDVYFEDCDFYSNGKQEYLIGSDTEDGCDFKCSTRAVFINCRFWDNGDKGLDFRSESGMVIGCSSWGNAGVGFASNVNGAKSSDTNIPDGDVTFIGCRSLNNGGAGFSVVPQTTTAAMTVSQITRIIGCHAEGNLHNYSVASAGTNQLTRSHIIISGSTSRSPAASGRHYNASAPMASTSISGGCNFTGGSNVAIGIHPDDVGIVQITGSTFKDIGNVVVAAADNSAAGSTLVSGCSFIDIAGAILTGNSNCTLSGNTYLRLLSSALYSFTGSNNRVLDTAQGNRTIASAASITLPEITQFFTISGTTEISSIAASWAGREVRLRFASTASVKDGGNLLLAGDFVGSSNDVLSLVCDGVNWLEVSRSVN